MKMLGRTCVDRIVGDYGVSTYCINLGDYGVSAYCINLGDDVTSCLFDEPWRLWS